MAGNDNAQSESQIAKYMLVVQSSNLYCNQDRFEIAVRQTIRQPDSTIVFWYEGYAILGFETIADYEATEEDLQDHGACGCVVRISRQEKVAASLHIYAYTCHIYYSANANHSSPLRLSKQQLLLLLSPLPLPPLPLLLLPLSVQLPLPLPLLLLLLLPPLLPSRPARLLLPKLRTTEQVGQPTLSKNTTQQSMGLNSLKLNMTQTESGVTLISFSLVDGRKLYLYLSMTASGLLFL